MTAMEAITEKLMPEDCWQMQEDILSVVRKELDRLPKAKEVSDQQCRYPETPVALRAFIEKFFARHFLQVQDSLLREDVFNQFADICTNSSSITILDIGAGPAVASLALLSILTQNQTVFHNINVRILINDTSRVCLEAGQRMIDAFMCKNLNCGFKISIQSLNIPFPENLSAVKRTITRWGKIDLFFLSYVLIPLKKELKYNEIKAGLKILKEQYCTKGSIGLILQDKFRESLVRTVGYTSFSESTDCLYSVFNRRCSRIVKGSCFISPEGQ